MTGNGYGRLLAKRFAMPDGCACRSFTMRQLRNRDQLEAGIWADKRVNSAAGERGQQAAEFMELIRLSFVAVDDKPVNNDGIPFLELDNWDVRSMQLVLKAYQDLNGMPDEELERFSQGGEAVDLSASSPEGPSIPPSTGG